jgi:hypothetical protein
MSDYEPGEIIVLARLWQRVMALCPQTGDEQVIADRNMEGLSKEQLVLYGDDWLDEAVADVPPGWLVKVQQSCELTSEQAPKIRDFLDGVYDRWRPAREAFRLAKKELRFWSRLKRWGGGGF